MLTDTIRLQYDVSSIIPEFGVCVLGPRGVSVHAQVNDPPSALPNEYGALEAVQHASISEDGASMFSEDLLDDFISLDSFDASEFPDFDAVEVEVGDAEESVTLTILLCPTCHRHFDRPLPSRNPRPPALAIANVLWFGRVPPTCFEACPRMPRTFARPPPCSRASPFTARTRPRARPRA